MLYLRNFEEQFKVSKLYKKKKFRIKVKYIKYGTSRLFKL